MRYQIILAPKVESSIKHLTEYISTNLNNPLAAIKLEQAIRKTIDGLCHYPKRHLIRDNIYSVRIKRCRLFYKIDDTNHVILIFDLQYGGQKLNFSLSESLNITHPVL